MTDTVNDRMTAAEFREQQAESGRRVASLPAVAVDPGKTTGVAIAFADGEIRAYMTGFWNLMDAIGSPAEPSIAQLHRAGRPFRLAGGGGGDRRRGRGVTSKLSRGLPSAVAQSCVGAL